MASHLLMPQSKAFLDKDIQGEFLDITTSFSCFVKANNDEIAPERVALWNAITGLAGSQQQGSSLSSTGSTNAVSKPSGPTALAEEFGGVNTTAGTSSTTIQWSPGTMFANLAMKGVTPICAPSNHVNGCVSAGFVKGISPLTAKVTVNTSNGSQSLSGKAASSGSSSSAQPVTVSNTASKAPSFGGITVQYSFYGSKSQAAATSLTTAPGSSRAGKAPKAPGGGSQAPNAIIPYYQAELTGANDLSTSLQACKEYQDWQRAELPGIHSIVDPIVAANAQSAPTTAQVQGLQKEIEKQYKDLLTVLKASKDTNCQSAIQKFSPFWASILEAYAYDDLGAIQKTSGKPELALEYDLNTPINKPAYSCVKGTLSLSLGKTKSAPVSAPTTKTATTDAAGNTHPLTADELDASLDPAQKAVRSYAKQQANVLANATGQSSLHTVRQAAANAKQPAADNTKPWTITMNGTADIYDSPPASVPGATHLRDIQAGAEIDYLFSPAKNAGTLRQFIGNVTAAAAYSYQDQTSPAILTGPALSTFTGLPGSTTTAYAQRGVIHLGQLRLGFGTGTNTSFPIAFTYSNRTELVVHPTWGLQFGVSYNLTSLFCAPKSGGS